MLRLPRDTERHAIVGKTGSGKTVFGMWSLSHRSYDRIPWVLLDFKRDPFIGAVLSAGAAEEIDIRRPPPRKAGLWVARPMPHDADTGTLTRFLFDLWGHEKTGLFIDEGYMIPRMDPALRAIITQGRSKRVPVIALSQRPAHISPFLLSEADHLSVFYLQNPTDTDRVAEYLPPETYADPYQLTDHHSYWYSVGSRQFRFLGPCPAEPAILDIFDARRPRRFRL